MEPDIETIARLIQKRMFDELSDEELNMLEHWTNASPSNQTVFKRLNNPGQLAVDLKIIADGKARTWEKLLSKAPGGPSSQPLTPPVHRIHFLRRGFMRYAAAVIIIVGIGAYLWNINTKKENPASTAKASANAVKNDIAPGANRAVLTLSDGSKISLDNTTAETITDGNQLIKNENGQLVYDSGRGSLSLSPEARQEKGGPANYNTMSTPRGGQYQLTLPDGTNVWLNAASSITYPTAFINNTREVTITGEAYFEVKKNTSKPFIVKTPKENITVLGTSFNVNAYPDEAFIKTSLIEGSVKVAGKILKPGQAYENGNIVPTNIGQDVAWKNGVFNFDNLTVHQVMRQLSRWYDIDVVFDKPVNEVFIGKMGRGLSLAQVLKGLDGAGVHFKLEGNTLHVFP